MPVTTRCAAPNHGVQAIRDENHWCAYLRQRQERSAYPYVEEFFTIAPAIVLDKQRPSFETLWRKALDPQSLYQQTVLPIA